MTERSTTGTERQGVCPFVAFEDDRDYRSSVPDHRHRCFAERPAAARALAHQAAYCLSSAFPGCPTFIDWARREAAPAKEEPLRTLREVPTAPRQADRPAEPVSRPMGPHDPSATPPRLRRPDWTAPPPWAPDAAADEGSVGRASRGRPDLGGEPSAGDGDLHDEVLAAVEPEADTSRGTWTGSALAGLEASSASSRDRDSGRPEPSDADHQPGSLAGPAEPLAPAFLAGRTARPAPAGERAILPAASDLSQATRRQGPVGRAAGYARDEMARPIPPRRGRSDASRATGRIAGRAPDRSFERAALDPAAPSWERPRRFEAYPSLRSSAGGLAALPRPVLYGLVVLIVGLALFATPFVFRGITGGGGTSASPTPAASASAGSSTTPSITPVPSPSPTIYTVKAGDVLSRIAAKYGITIEQITQANPQIKNPDKLAVGDQLVIPPVVAPAITDGTITPAPSG